MLICEIYIAGGWKYCCCLKQGWAHTASSPRTGLLPAYVINGVFIQGWKCTSLLSIISESRWVASCMLATSTSNSILKCLSSSNINAYSLRLRIHYLFGIWGKAVPFNCFNSAQMIKLMLESVPLAVYKCQVTMMLRSPDSKLCSFST